MDVDGLEQFGLVTGYNHANDFPAPLLDGFDANLKDLGIHDQ